MPNPMVGQAVWKRAQVGAHEVKVAAGGIVLAVVAAVIAVACSSRAATRRPKPEIALELPAQIVRPDPLRFEPGRTEEYEQAAAFGLSHVLFEKSPGGVMRAAQRTARFREIVDSAVSGSGIDPDMVEAIVLLESAGREDVIAGDDPENAAGLTQILAETATSFLGMPVDLEASRRLTRLLDEAVGRGDEAEADRLRSERRGVDARFDPEQALAGTVRYLTEAKKVFGRDDLAVVSYHMGIGNLASVVRAYTGRRRGSDRLGRPRRRHRLRAPLLRLLADPCIERPGSGSPPSETTRRRTTGASSRRSGSCISSALTPADSSGSPGCTTTYRAPSSCFTRSRAWRYSDAGQLDAAVERWSARAGAARHRRSLRDRSAARKDRGASDGEPGHVRGPPPPRGAHAGVYHREGVRAERRTAPAGGHTSDIRRGACGDAHSARSGRCGRCWRACNGLRLRHTQAVRIRSSGGSISMDARTSRGARADRVDEREVSYPRRRVSDGRRAVINDRLTTTAIRNERSSIDGRTQ